MSVYSMYDQVKTWSTFLFAQQQERPLLQQLNDAVMWLLHSQQQAQATGFAHSFHLLKGWFPAYPETTGYIIPTLLKQQRIQTDVKVARAIQQATEWLLSIQNSDGSFSDLQQQKQVFDSGQILQGLNALWQQHASPEVTSALQRVAHWLCVTQESNGSFVQHAFFNRAHSYYSKVGAALIHSGILLKEDIFLEAGIRNIAWTLQQQQENGFFAHTSFDGSAWAFSHTMVYVLEGLLDSFDLLQQPAYLNAARLYAEKLLTTNNILYSQYDQQYHARNKHHCLTGNAQWALICERLAKHLNDSRYLIAAEKNLKFLQQQQLISSNADLHGGLLGSRPCYGLYMRLAIPNWGVKYFADLLQFKVIELDCVAPDPDKISQRIM